MLDQNTDRMWYVIGAILIGAAIIFGMNWMAPSAFASVSDMFGHTIGAVEDVIDPEPEGNLIDLSGEQEIVYNKRIHRVTGEIVDNHSDGWRGDPEEVTETWYSMITGIPVRGGSTYRFSAPEGFASPFVAYYDRNGDYIDYHYFGGEPVLDRFTTAPRGAVTAYLAGGDPDIKPERNVDTLNNWVFEKATKPKKNYLLDSESTKSTTGHRYIDYYLDVNAFNDLSGQQVTVSFEAKANDGTHLIDSYFRIHDGTIRVMGDKSKPFALTSQFQRFSHTFTVPDFSEQLDHPMSFRFRGNQFVNGALVDGVNTNTGHFSVRRVKVELGTNDSGFIPHESD